MSAVARWMGLSWNEAANIQGRAVARGLKRKERGTATGIGIDETSFQKRHEYVTIVCDLITSEVPYVAKAWVIKEMASKLWHYKSKTWAKKAWLSLCNAADATGLAPLQRVARTIRLYWIGITNAVVKKVSNARSESVNSRVQKLKSRANGYRNRQRFRDAIMFHLGGLDLYPARAFHSNS